MSANGRDSSVLPSLRTVTIVTVLTVLIWVFAEGETLRSATRRVDIEVFSGSDRRYVQVARDQEWSGTVEVRFEGTTAALERLRELLQGVLPLTAGVDFPSGTGRHVLNLRETLRDHELLERTGVTVAEVAPATLMIDVDELVQREIRVRVEAPQGRLEAPGESSPPVVMLTLLGSAAGLVDDDTAAVARIEDERLRSLTPGRRETILNVRLEPPPTLTGLGFARLDPPQVDVSLTLAFNERELVLPSVPVHLKVAAVEFNNWQVTIPEGRRRLLNVRVTGPDELIKQIESGQILVIAVVPLSFEDLENGITEKRAVFADLPGPLRFEAEDATVPLEIRRRSSPGSTGGLPDGG